jgi:hypothetical protein
MGHKRRKLGRNLFEWRRKPRNLILTIVCFLSFFKFLGVVWDLSPLGTSDTNWSTVTVPDHRLRWMWSSRWNENWQGQQKYSEKNYPTATSSTIKPTWPDLGCNPDLRGGKSEANRLGYGTAIFYFDWGINRQTSRGSVFVEWSGKREMCTYMECISGHTHVCICGCYCARTHICVCTDAIDSQVNCTYVWIVFFCILVFCKSQKFG